MKTRLSCNCWLEHPLVVSQCEMGLLTTWQLNFNQILFITGLGRPTALFLPESIGWGSHKLVLVPIQEKGMWTPPAEGSKNLQPYCKTVIDVFSWKSGQQKYKMGWMSILQHRSAGEITDKIYKWDHSETRHHQVLKTWEPKEGDHFKTSYTNMAWMPPNKCSQLARTHENKRTDMKKYPVERGSQGGGGMG